MDWIKELLKDVVEESKLEEVISNVNKEAPKYIVPKDKYNELSTEKKNLETEISNRDTQLEELKTKVGSNTELQGEIERLKAENTANQEKYNADLTNERKRNAIETELIKQGAVNTKACLPFIDLETIELKDGEIKGVNDLVTNLVKSEDTSFLFKPNKINGMNVVGNPGGNTPPADTSEVGKIAEEQNKEIKEVVDPWQ